MALSLYMSAAEEYEAVEWFSFKNSTPLSKNVARVTSLKNFREKRREGVDVRIFFNEGDKFVNPAWLGEVKKAIEGCSQGCSFLNDSKRVKLKINRLTCTTTWTFSDPNGQCLRSFDEYYKNAGVPIQKLDLDRSVRILLPQHVYLFLQDGHDFLPSCLEDWTILFQHYPKYEKKKKKDSHDFFGSKMFTGLLALEKARAENKTMDVIKYSSIIQMSMATRTGFTGILAGMGLQDDTALDPENIEEFEDMLRNFDKEDSSGGRGGVPRKKGRPVSVLDEMKGFCSQQARVNNSYGNIIVNSGRNTIIGGRNPCVTLSWEAAKLFGFWEHLAASCPKGDLFNDKLLERTRKGPLLQEGAWTYHLIFNEAVHVDSGLTGKDEARSWLKDKLSRHLARWVTKGFLECLESSDSLGSRSVHDLEEEAVGVMGDFLEGASLEEVSSGHGHLRAWLRSKRAEPWLPKSRCVVTAMQRHGLTGDPAMAVRHPITQPVPFYDLMISSVLSGYAIMMPPQFANLSELDYDGDKMKLASERALMRRKLLESCLSVHRLQYNALGKQVVNLTGVAPLALNLAQANGACSVSPSHLSFSGPAYSKTQATTMSTSSSNSRKDSGHVVWNGGLETSYSIPYFFDSLDAMGLAVPDKMTARWSRPSFHEVAFQAMAEDGSWVNSVEMNVSHDGFYPTPCNWSESQQCNWITSMMSRHGDLFPGLKRPFCVRICARTPPRASSLDGITFAQMRSLVHMFPNFLKKEITVPHMPGLVNRGVFCTYVRALGPYYRWHRMASCLLKLSFCLPKKLTLGHNAIVAAMLYYSWRPTADDVTYCLMSKENELQAHAKSLGIPELSDVMMSGKEGIARLVGHAGSLEESGFVTEAQMLRRFSFLWKSPSSHLRSQGDTLDIECAKELWRSLNLSHLCTIKAVAKMDPENLDHHDYRLLSETPFGRVIEDESPWTYDIVFERKKMEEQDWTNLKVVSKNVGRLCQTRHPLLRPETISEAGGDEEELRYIIDWGRFVGSIMHPKRQDMDVQKSLDALATLRFKDFESCKTKDLHRQTCLTANINC